MVAIFLMILRVVLSIFLYAMLGFLAAIVGACAFTLVAFFWSTPDIPLSVDPNELRQDPRRAILAVNYALYFAGYGGFRQASFGPYILVVFFVMTLFYNNTRNMRFRLFLFGSFCVLTCGIILLFIFSSFLSGLGSVSSQSLMGGNPHANLIIAGIIGLVSLLFAILQFAAAFVAIRAVQFLRPCPKAQSPVAA